jgi:hypothetical protein
MFSIITLPAGIALICVGIWIAIVPPERILRFDRRAGYLAYKREKERSGDEGRALRAASYYYRIHAALWVSFGLVLDRRFPGRTARFLGTGLRTRLGKSFARACRVFVTPAMNCRARGPASLRD